MITVKVGKPQNAVVTVGKSVALSTSGTKNYNDLTNKPSINGVELQGNKTSADLYIDTYESLTNTEILRIMTK